MVEPIFQAPPPPPMNHDEEPHAEQVVTENPADITQNDIAVTQPTEEPVRSSSQKEQVLTRLNELKENFVRYFWYSVAGLFLLGMFFGCAMSGGDSSVSQKLPAKAITRIIANRQTSRRLPICGTALLSEACVFYILNYSITDHRPEDYFSYVANSMQRPVNSIKTENIQYNELIPPGYFAEIIVPVKR